MTLDFEHKLHKLGGHSRRPSTGSMSVRLRKTLRGFSYLMICGSLVSVAATVAIRVPPTWAGWGLILVSGLTFLSGVLNCFFIVSCFSYQVLALGLSMGGLGSASLLLFIKQQMVEQHLKSKRSDYYTRLLMRIDGVLFTVMLCFQMVMLMLAFFVYHCSYENYYEDLESRNNKRAHELVKIQEESEKRTSKANDSHAAELNKKMREKYGKWTQEGEFGDRAAPPTLAADK